MDTLVIAFTLLTGHTDAARLAQAARLNSVPPLPFMAMMWEETRDGRKGNDYRGPGKVICDSLCRRVCREVGRAQISPCYVKDGKIYPVDWSFLGSFCRTDSLYVYWSNVRCGAAIYRHRYQQCGQWDCATRAYNGGGQAANEYLERVKATLGLYFMRAYGTQENARRGGLHAPTPRAAP